MDTEYGAARQEQRRKIMEIDHEYSKGGQIDGMTEDDISDRMRWS